MSRAWLLAVALAGCATPRVEFRAAAATLRYDPSECAAEDQRTLRRHGRDATYDAVRARWTRHAYIMNDYDTALDARVVILSPEFRAAYARKVALVNCLAADDYLKLVALSQAEAERGIDVVVLLDSSRWEWNDLSSPKSIWTVTFADDQHRVVGPIEKQPLTDKPETLNALFDGGNAFFVSGSPFTRGWRLRFPKQFPDGAPLIRPDTKHVTVRFAGPLGSDQVVWVAR